MDDVHCSGYERSLNECEHNGYGIHNCALNQEEAGVICNGMNPLLSFSYQIDCVWVYHILFMYR